MILRTPFAVLATAAAMTLAATPFANEAHALCAAFVCKHPTCRYQIRSETGVRVLSLASGERRVISGLGPSASYCDWVGGCVTPHRPVMSLNAC
jgi:hypothetical protein